MSTISTEIANIKAQLDLIKTGIASLVAKIAALSAAATGDQLSPTTQSALDDVLTEATALDAAANPPTGN